MNREFLQLAKTYDPEKHSVGGYYVSEKFDGMRAFWDGGRSRGLLCSAVPYANIEKDFRRINPVHATGLWSRYAKPIVAPDWFLDSLPEDVFLDGELFLERNKFQHLISITKTQNTTHPDWHKIAYRVFDIPTEQMLFMPGKINNPHCKMEIYDTFLPKTPVVNFTNVLRSIERVANKVIIPVMQNRLPGQIEKAKDELYNMLDYVESKGGEGLMLRSPGNIWRPKRNETLLKVKSMQDSEATVIGYYWGKGKYEGLMGSLEVRWNGKTFKLSGFTDEERVLTELESNYTKVPGEKVYSHSNLLFRVGTIITFKYQGVTKDGIPRSARYYRAVATNGK